MNDLRALLDSSEGVLLDFDGPVCKLFAGYPAAVIADELRDYLITMGADLDDSVKGTSDPLALLRWTALQEPALLEPLEQREVVAECSAAETATLTEHAYEVIILAVESGRPVAIVSNNSRAAIERFLDLNGLSSEVTSIVSRVFGRPDLMKPSVEPVIKAAGSLNLLAKACVLVGDSVADMAAARNAGSRCIGYAKNSVRAGELNAEGADVVIYSMGAVVASLRDLLGR
jgi:phosphoglycolate phosphatase